MDFGETNVLNKISFDIGVGVKSETFYLTNLKYES